MGGHRRREIQEFLTRLGDDLLSHTLRCSTIGAAVLNDQVRDGTGCFTRAMFTKPRKKLGLPRATIICPVQHTKRDFQSIEARLLLDQIKPIGPLVPVN